MGDYLFKGSLEELDPEVAELIHHEQDRQRNRLILIPSESMAPPSILEAMGSEFQNVYAEGYPHEITRHMSQEDILDYPSRLTHYRRYADPRYYKGVEFADIAEALARQRCAELFATERVPADQLYVNVQTLSGAPANNAVYQALLEPGDTLMGMNLLHGGHLTHGSPVNRSGKLYHVVSYEVDPHTEQLDYDAIEALALQAKPKVIVAGYSSYPIIPDWARFRQIADATGAKLVTDISHIAGLVAAKVVPSPVGYAHVITFTTHKTLCGPRGACVITDNAALAGKIDRAVFPGEQGGPHLNTIVALATAFKFAATAKFVSLQREILANCKTMVNRLQERGLHISYGGTNSHLANIDCKSVKGPDGTPLDGDLAARILDVAGITVNRNTIPGDRSALSASGVRFGTPWVTQRGLEETDMVELADIIADLLTSITPYQIQARKGTTTRAKVDFHTLETIKLRVRTLCQKANSYSSEPIHGYPFNYFIDEPVNAVNGKAAYDIYGGKTLDFVNFVFASDAEKLLVGETQKTTLFMPSGAVNGWLHRTGAEKFQVIFAVEEAAVAAAWLRDLSDAYIGFDDDLLRRIPGPVTINGSTDIPDLPTEGESICARKPYYIGKQKVFDQPLPVFSWNEPIRDTPKRTPLFDTHVSLGGKMVEFAGWEMPVQYTSISDEHVATRTAAGLFDVSHMGVFQAEGPCASVFLDSVCGNDIGALEVGESCYTHFLDPDARVIDDLIVYRRAVEKYLVVVNASNEEKDWAWLAAVQQGTALIDHQSPGARAFGRKVFLRNLKDPQAGEDMKVDIALQGPKSQDILLSLGADRETIARVKNLSRSQLCEATIGGFELVVSRTGYTGETISFELFVHPDQAVDFWNALMKAGTSKGLKPCGLGARDSLRTEYGLPLYGHELDGPYHLTVGQAGFAYFVKTYKPWFIGRQAFLEQEAARQTELVRFRFLDQRTKKAHLGDPVLNDKGRVIGRVTSCAIDTEGYFSGMALVESKFSAENTEIAIFQGSPDEIGKMPNALVPGDRFSLPSRAIVLSRYLMFAKKK